MKLSFKAFIANNQVTDFMQRLDTFKKGEVIGALEYFDLEISETEKTDVTPGEILTAFAKKGWGIYVEEFSKLLMEKGYTVILVVPDNQILEPILLVKDIFKISDGHKFYFFAPSLEKLGLEVQRGPNAGVVNVNWPRGLEA